MTKFKPGTRVRVSYGRAGEREYTGTVLSHNLVQWDDLTDPVRFELDRTDLVGRVEVIEDEEAWADDCAAAEQAEYDCE